MAIFGTILVMSFCNWSITENQKAHDRFVATVDYLQPQIIEGHFSGRRVLQEATSDLYENGEIYQYGEPKKYEYWSYDVQLTPISRDEAVTGYCQPYSDRPGCVWSFYVMTIIAEKDGQKFVTSVRWQSGTGFDPEAWFKSQGYTIVRNQYFAVSYNDVVLDPEFNDTIADLDSITGPWISAVGEREGIPQLP